MTFYDKAATEILVEPITETLLWIARATRGRCSESENKSAAETPREKSAAALM